MKSENWKQYIEALEKTGAKVVILDWTSKKVNKEEKSYGLKKNERPDKSAA